MKRFPVVLAAFAAATLGSVSLHPVAMAAGAKKSPSKTATAKPLPRYVSLATLKKLQAARSRRSGPLPILQPFIDGEPIRDKDMKDLAVNPPVVVVQARVGEVEAGGMA